MKKVRERSGNVRGRSGKVTGRSGNVTGRSGKSKPFLGYFKTTMNGKIS